MFSNPFFPASVTQEVKAEQIRLLYHQGSVTQLLGIFSGLVALSMFWEVADRLWLMTWFGIHSALSLLRLLQTEHFNRSSPSVHDIVARHGWYYVAGTTLSGAVWASLCLFYEPSWPQAHQIALFVIYTGITAGAYNTNSSHFIAFPAFYLLPVGTLAWTVLNNPQSGSFGLAILIGIYILLMYVSAIKFHNRLAHSLEIRFENERLVEELAESNRKLKHLADIDELTGIANRRAMDASLDSEWKRHRRTKAPLSLLFIDIDYFKQFNDTYGHEEGDRCLTRVAGLLRAQVRRAGEQVARFGGEEFAVILPDTAKAGALHLAESIRVELENLAIPHASSRVADIVTASIGVTSLIPGRSSSIEEMRQTADRALYQAKRMGRNRVVWLPFAD